MAQEDRTEAATPRRLQRAREEGNVAASREVAPLAGLAAVTLIIAVAGQGLGTLLLGRLELMLVTSSGGNVGITLAAALLAMVSFVGPIVLGILVAAVTASLLQTGPIFNPGKLRPDLGRLSVARGLGRLFGTSALIEATKAIAKVTVFGLALYHVLTSHSLMLRTAVFWYPNQIVARTTTLFLQVSETLLAAQFAIACADIVWTRHQHARQLRMTKEEVRQDAKDADGNPQAKSRLRQIRMTRSRQRMLAAVPKATVVVTNPTHYAVALSYDLYSRRCAAGGGKRSGRRCCTDTGTSASLRSAFGRKPAACACFVHGRS